MVSLRLISLISSSPSPSKRPWSKRTHPRAPWLSFWNYFQLRVTLSKLLVSVPWLRSPCPTVIAPRSSKSENENLTGLREKKNQFALNYRTVCIVECRKAFSKRWATKLSYTFFSEAKQQYLCETTLKTFLWKYWIRTDWGEKHLKQLKYLRSL